jgi:glycerol-3-phosphate dehydrogenase
VPGTPSTADHRLYDVLIVGGGVNGTGVARDLALRGLSVVLVEKKDFAAGASGANSGMIHGGIRYLRQDPGVTEISSRDSGYIQRIAPHLLFRIPFIFPVLRRGAVPTLAEQTYLYGAEVYFSAYDVYQPLKGGRPSSRLTPEEALTLEPGLRPELVGAVTTDEWGIDPQRLCAANALSAQANGAVLFTHTEVLALPRDADGRMLGAEVRRGGRKAFVRARTVLNAGGPWAARVAALAGVEVKLRPGKGVHLTLDRRLSNYGIIANAVDGRQIFLYPHEQTSIIGTTDDDYYGDLDHIPISHDEVEYLLCGIESVLPEVRRARIQSAWAGIRPTLFEYGPTEEALPREHAVVDHSGDGVPGFYSLLGGKLASYRLQSEEASDLIAHALGNTEPCRTHLLPLPGGESRPDPAELGRAHGFPAWVAERCVYRHGAKADAILSQAHDEPWLRGLLCPCEQVTYAEARHCVREELAENLSDLRRRCRLGMGLCQGLRCATPAASLMRAELGWTPDATRAELWRFLQSRFEGQAPVLDGESLAQHELLRQSYFQAGALQRP